ncbi:hypothetical protein [uncultured Phascolarctobacterium sp.]|uniref:hypothetical protein n=1 Tax=uncultured Phascolarctobacterium sp. TaxID=512296 RepID=UPI002603455C|nr:hypothetical protein [uncultured Phascolarctobacterium sp.]
MKGLLNIYIEKNTGEISILIYHVTTIGFSRSIGKIIDNISNESLKETVIKCIKFSLAEYKSEDKENLDPFKLTKYKTWNRFFNMHYIVEVTYIEENQEYYIKMLQRKKATKSFGSAVSGFEFKIKREDFDSQFDSIIKKIMDNLEEYQS